MSRRRPKLYRAVVGAVAVVAFAVATNLAWAIGTLDQRPGPVGSTSGICEGNKLAQTFTAGRTGSLDTVQLRLFRLEDPGVLVVSIVGTDSLANPGFPDEQDILATQTVAESEVAGGNLTTSTPSSSMRRRRSRPGRSTRSRLLRQTAAIPSLARGTISLLTARATRTAEASPAGSLAAAGRAAAAPSIPMTTSSRPTSRRLRLRLARTLR